MVIIIESNFFSHNNINSTLNLHLFQVNIQYWIMYMKHLIFLMDTHARYTQRRLRNVLRFSKNEHIYWQTCASRKLLKAIKQYANEFHQRKQVAGDTLKYKRNKIQSFSVSSINKALMNKCNTSWMEWISTLNEFVRCVQNSTLCFNTVGPPYSQVVVLNLSAAYRTLVVVEAAWAVDIIIVRWEKRLSQSNAGQSAPAPL